jgi:glucosylceramidase
MIHLVITSPARSASLAGRRRYRVKAGEESLHVTSDISRRTLLRAAAVAGLAAPLVTETRASAQGKAGTAVRMTTTANLSTEVMATSPLPAFARLTAGSSDVVVKPASTYQPFLGVGAAMTDSAAYVLANYMTPAQRSALLTELYAPGGTCNWGMLRVCIGSADFRAETVGYTYDDMPAGQTDPTLANFSIAKDKAYVLPAIQQVVAVNPGVKILACPWTPPAWMLASGTFEEGKCTFDDTYMAAFAQYFVKFLQAYEAAGVPVWGVTAQNEPVSGWFLKLSTSQEATFIRAHLGPALAAAGFGHVQILAMDNSWASYSSYLEPVLQGAGSYATGAAYHGYVGSPSDMASVHKAYPSVGHHCTEYRSLTSQSLSFQMGAMAGGYTAQSVAAYAQSVMVWNLALDQNGAPNQNKPGRIPAVTINNGTGALTRRTGYYALTHLSKFAQAGAVRCAASTFGREWAADTTLPNNVTTAALLNPDGSIVLYAYNGYSSNKTFHIVDARTSRGTKVTMVPGELSTFTWPSGQ